MSIQQLLLSSILTDAGTQMRVETSESTIGNYVEFLRQGCVFPAIIVFTDGLLYWLADGFHRLEAHKRFGLESILCDIREGTLIDAKRYACEANTDHGLQRTNDGKRNAIKEYLKLPGIAEMSDLQIAKKLRVSNHLVSEVRTNMKVAPSPKAHVGNGSKKKERTEKKRPAEKSGGFTTLYNISVDNPAQFVSVLRSQFKKPYLDSISIHLQRSLEEE